MLVQQLISSSKYDVKCPYSMAPVGICIHNTANDASAQNEINYMVGNNNEVSYHIAIDDVQSIQAIPFNRNAWHAGDGGSGAGNRNYIAIEICYSKSGGTKFTEAEKRAAVEVAALLKQFGWGISNVKKHQDFSGKYCPHRTLDMGWQRFLNMIQTNLNDTSNKPTIAINKTVDRNNPYGAYLNLNPNVGSWRVYNTNVEALVGNECGYLAPSQFGGLSYEIIGNPKRDIFKIRTSSFGEVTIYAPNDSDSSITQKPIY